MRNASKVQYGERQHVASKRKIQMQQGCSIGSNKLLFISKATVSLKTDNYLSKMDRRDRNKSVEGSAAFARKFRAHFQILALIQLSTFGNFQKGPPEFHKSPP
jgi:hypothetical protein